MPTFGQKRLESSQNCNKSPNLVPLWPTEGTMLRRHER